jgi:hypothetical protein
MAPMVPPAIAATGGEDLSESVSSLLGVSSVEEAGVGVESVFDVGVAADVEEVSVNSSDSSDSSDSSGPADLVGCVDCVDSVLVSADSVDRDGSVVVGSASSSDCVDSASSVDSGDSADCVTVTVVGFEVVVVDLVVVVVVVVVVSGSSSASSSATRKERRSLLAAFVHGEGGEYPALDPEQLSFSHSQSEKPSSPGTHRKVLPSAWSIV